MYEIEDRHYAHGSVGAINLLGNDDISLESADLGPFLELNGHLGHLSCRNETTLLIVILMYFWNRSTGFEHLSHVFILDTTLPG